MRARLPVGGGDDHAMRRPALLCLAPAAMIAACQADEPREPTVPANEAAVPAANEAEPPAPDNGTDREAMRKMPPASATVRFVGMWAADESLCATTAWRFAGDRLNTPAGSVCRFQKVREVPGGYDITARCTAEGPETEDRIRLRFAESAQAMMFESEVIADAGLIYCGPLTDAR
jgi:hypothetical protein